MATLRDTLRDLFSNKLIVKRDRDNSIKTVDYNRRGSSGNLGMRTYKGAYSTRGGNRMPNIAAYGVNESQEQLDNFRRRLYNDYDAMDQDPLIAGALDIYAEEAASEDDGEILKINTSDVKKKKILRNLYYDILNVNYNLHSWIREACKYGDYMLHVQLHPEFGYVDAVPIHPGNIIRDEFAGEDDGEKLIQFKFEGDSYNTLAKEEFEEFEIAHFRMQGDSSFLPYGKSLLEGARNEFKKFTMLEDAMLISRIMRAPDRRIIKIDVGNIAPEEVDGFMEDIINTMKKVPYKDKNGNYNLQFNLQNMLEDIYLPVRSDKSGTEVNNLDGLKNEGQIDDVEYSRDKILSFLKIPKSYLNYDEDTDGKNMLANQDSRFTKTIRKIQQVFTSELHKLGMIQLFMNGYTGEDLMDFQLELAISSNIYERQKIDLLSEQLNAVEKMLELKMHSREWIYENIFNFSEEEWEYEKDQVIEDLKYEFRQNQIKEEGNDPKESGEVVGTPHALMLLQASSRALGLERDDPIPKKVQQKIYPDERGDNPGRPPEIYSYETERDPIHGRDPSGRRGANPSLYSLSNNPSNLKLSHLARIEDKLKPSKTKLFENVKDSEGNLTKKIDNLDLSFLKEENLLDELGLKINGEE